MKKIYTTLAFLFLFFAAHAQWQQPQRQNRGRAAQTPYMPVSTPAALHLTLSATNNYTITIAGQSLSFYGNSFFIENVNPGLVMVTIAYSRQAPNGAYWQTAYNGAVNFEANTRVFASVDGFGVLRVTGREIIAVPQNPQNPQLPPNNGYPQNPQVVFATQLQADALIARLKAIPFDNDKVQTAKNALRYTHYSAAQVKEILKTFSFDKYKLEVAKYAYDVSYDKGNFFMVGDAFSFSSYANLLEKYIASK